MNSKTGILAIACLLIAVHGPLDGQDFDTGRAYVCLKSTATTSAEELYLGDVAEISGFDEELISSLRELSLGPSPLPGEKIVLARGDIRRRMVVNNVDPVRAPLTGEERVEVLRDGSMVTGDDLKALVRDYVHSCWQNRDARTEIIYSRLPEDSSIEDGCELRVMDPVRPMVTGSISLSVAALREGRVVSRMPVSLKVRAFTDVAVMQRDISRGDILSPGDFSLEERELTRMRARPLTTVEQAAGKRARRNIRAGEVLTSSHLESPPLIERGDEVMLVVDYRGIRVGCPGKAWEAGALGDKIMVRNQYGRNLVGEILDSGTVRITQ